jgi:hypothetical protein
VFIKMTECSSPRRSASHFSERTRWPPLDARDAVFAALALNRGIDAILTTDRAFDGIADLERIDPTDEQADRLTILRLPWRGRDSRGTPTRSPPRESSCVRIAAWQMNRSRTDSADSA